MAGGYPSPTESAPHDGAHESILDIQTRILCRISLRIFLEGSNPLTWGFEVRFVSKNRSCRNATPMVESVLGFVRKVATMAPFEAFGPGIGSLASAMSIRMPPAPKNH